MHPKIKQIGKSILFIGTGVVILYIVFRGFQQDYLEQCIQDGGTESSCSLLDKLWMDFLSVNPFWIFLACLGFIISNVSRSIRWKLLLEPLGYKLNIWTGFWAIMLGYFTNLGFPRIGEVIRSGTVTRYEGVPLEKSMGTVVSDRIIDMFSFAIILGLALMFEFDILWGQIKTGIIDKVQGLGNNSSLYIISGIALVALIILYFFRRRLYALGIVVKIRSILQGFWEGLQSVRKIKNFGAFLFHSFIIWFMYYIMMYLCFLSFEPTAHLGLIPALLVFVFGSLGMIIPSPGGMGSYHALVALALTLYGVANADAFSFANIMFFSITLFCNVLFGVLALIVLPFRQRKQIKT